MSQTPFESCPLCVGTMAGRKFKRLYGISVCRDCHLAFASRRQGAFVADFIVYGLVCGLGAAGLTAVWENTNLLSPVGEILYGAWAIVTGLAFLGKDGFRGHSLGKAANGLQVVDCRTYQPVGFLRSVLRNLPILSLLVFVALGFVHPAVILLAPIPLIILGVWLHRGYRPGDGWAGTKVIWKKYANRLVFTGQGACEHCQYDLRGNTTGVCPECGAALSPTNRAALGLPSQDPKAQAA